MKFTYRNVHLYFESINDLPKVYTVETVAKEALKIFNFLGSIFFNRVVDKNMQ